MNRNSALALVFTVALVGCSTPEQPFDEEHWSAEETRVEVYRTTPMPGATPGPQPTPARSAESRRDSAPAPESTPIPTPPPEPTPKPETAPVSETTAPTGKEEIPFGSPVPGKPGFVTSPYSPGAGYIDVTGLAPGSKARDPYTNKVFRVP